MMKQKPKTDMSADEMKDSGVALLGDIPSHWEVLSLRWCSRIRSGEFLSNEVIDAREEKEYMVPVVGANGVIGYSCTPNCFEPTIVIGRVGTSGTVHLITHRSWITDNALRLYDIRGFSLAYLENLLLTLDLNRLSVSTAQPLLTGGQLKAQIVIRPPLPEQRAIAAYLDRETGVIDALIAKTERLNALLREKRVALISQAVTKGLDPAAPLKDSGVEWLGEIPRHWEVKRLKHLGRLKSGDAITSEEIDPVGDYPVYGGNGIRGYTVEFTHRGDYVLIGRQGALCGNINYAHGRFWASEHAVVVNQTGSENVKWLGEVLRAMNLNQYSLSAAQPGLSVERIESLQVPVPPVNETHSLAAHLDRETAQIDALINKNDKLIALLREKRTALISAAVTGKISLPPPQTPPP